MARRQSTDHEVGKCPCGARIMLGDRYSVSTERPTTVKRACPSCERTNEIVLTVRAIVKRATWKAHECLCGSGIYLRSDYAGRTFEGAEPLTGLDRLVQRSDDYKNRTVKTACRGCACKYIIQIRFKREKDAEGEMSLFRDWSTKVQRCRPCRVRKERRDSASA